MFTLKVKRPFQDDTLPYREMGWGRCLLFDSQDSETPIEMSLFLNLQPFELKYLHLNLGLGTHLISDPPEGLRRGQPGRAVWSRAPTPDQAARVSLLASCGSLGGRCNLAIPQLSCLYNSNKVKSWPSCGAYCKV